MDSLDGALQSLGQFFFGVRLERDGRPAGDERGLGQAIHLSGRRVHFRVKRKGLDGPLRQGVRGAGLKNSLELGGREGLERSPESPLRGVLNLGREEPAPPADPVPDSTRNQQPLGKVGVGGRNAAALRRSRRHSGSGSGHEIGRFPIILAVYLASVWRSLGAMRSVTVTLAAVVLLCILLMSCGCAGGAGHSPEGPKGAGPGAGRGAGAAAPQPLGRPRPSRDLDTISRMIAQEHRGAGLEEVEDQGAMRAYQVAELTQATRCHAAPSRTAGCCGGEDDELRMPARTASGALRGMVRA